MQLVTVRIDKPDDANFILGQTHFIKSVKAVHEALVAVVPGINFGLAFCEASGKCLVRWSGADPAMTELAKKNAAAIGAGHSFIVFLGDRFHPLNVLNTLKMAPDNPKLPHDDFAAAIRIAQAEFDQHRPEALVGSSRGGTRRHEHRQRRGTARPALPDLEEVRNGYDTATRRTT